MNSLTYGGAAFGSASKLTNGDGNGPYLRIDSKDSSGGSTVSGSIKITSAKTYWVNLNYVVPRR